MLPTSTPSRSPLQRIVPFLLGSLFFIYLWLGPQRFFPPIDPWLPLGILITLSVWWIFVIYKKRGLTISPITLPLIAFLAATTLSTATSIDVRLSLDDLLTTLVCTITLLMFCDVLYHSWRPTDVINIFLTSVGLLTFQGLTAIVNWFWFWYQLRVPNYPLVPVPLRLFTIADQPNLLASVLYLALPWLIVRLENAQHRWARLGYGVWLLGITIVMFFTRSRGGWVATLAVITITVGWLVIRRVRATSSIRAATTMLATTMMYLLFFSALLLFDRYLSPVAVSSNAGVEQRQQGVEIALGMLRDHPFTGAGPFTFGRMYVALVAANRAWVDIHPHNLYADLLAQRGLLGFGAFIWIVLVAVRHLVPLWNKSVRSCSAELSEQERIIVAASASLAGYLAHGLIDVPTRLPFNALWIVIICALAMHAIGALRPNRPLPRPIAISALLVPIVLGGVIWRYGQAQDALLQGILAGQRGDWSAAVRSLDVAVAADPQFDFYQGQRAFAYGMLGETSTGSSAQAALSQSLIAYLATIRQEPGYEPHLLNTVALAELVGNGDIRHVILEAAIPHGVDWPIALILAADQHPQDSAALYKEAFRADPLAGGMAACRRSEACRTAAAQIRLDAIAMIDQQAQQLLEDKQPQRALELLTTIPVNDPTPSIWIDRANAHLALDQLPQARYTLSVASVSSMTPSARLQRVRALLNLREQRVAAAMASLEQTARPAIDEAVYSYAVFLRIGLPGTFLPSLDRLQRTDDDLQVYRQLADLYTQAGRADDAAWAQSQADALAKLLDQ